MRANQTSGCASARARRLSCASRVLNRGLSAAIPPDARIARPAAFALPGVGGLTLSRPCYRSHASGSHRSTKVASWLTPPLDATIASGFGPALGAWLSPRWLASSASGAIGGNDARRPLGVWPRRWDRLRWPWRCHARRRGDVVMARHRRRSNRWRLQSARGRRRRLGRLYRLGEWRRTRYCARPRRIGARHVDARRGHPIIAGAAAGRRQHARRDLGGSIGRARRRWRRDGHRR